MALQEYRKKRLFNKTPEPKGGRVAKSRGALRFVVQMHAATRLHYDFRIEVGGVFKSWAVPKGPSLNPLDQRLAVRVEDHPLEYGSFEGIIPSGNYGAGTVMVWDAGTFTERGSENRAEGEKALKRGLEAGHITIVLEGHKLRGEFAFVRLKKGDEKSWLLLKKRDGFAKCRDITEQDRSILSGRSMNDIKTESHQKGDLWLPGNGRASKKRQPKIPKPAPNSTVLQKKARAPKAALKSTRKAKTALSREAQLPRGLKPMMPEMGNEAFDDPNWIFELGGDGQRALAAVRPGNVQLYSRQLLSYNAKFPEIVSELKKIDTQMLLDGEIIDDKYVVKDLLHLDGENLRERPLTDRKNTLASLPIFSSRVVASPFVQGKGLQFAKAAAKNGTEWILAKQKSSPYESGIHASWQKIRLAAPREGASFSHLDKIYWPEERYTKGDLIDYYRAVSKFILPYLNDRPQSLHRHPDGVQGQSFFHKDMTGYLPRFLKTERIYSESSAKSVNYLLCQNEASLLYMANLGCIELNPWISRVGQLDNPDFVVIDLDPDDNDFTDVIDVALHTHEVLKKAGAQAFCKTSGASGLHICVPVAPIYSYDDTREWALKICKRVFEKFPRLTSLERSPSKRQGKIYLDYLQNRRGATLAAPYCVRPRPTATVSAPLKWSELKSGKLRPTDFTIKNMLERLKKVGDLWSATLNSTAKLKPL